MSLVSYNGIVLPYSHFTHFVQEPVDDDLSHTDRIGTRFDLTCQCIININYLSIIAPHITFPAQPNNPADIINSIRKWLLQKRKVLSVKINGVEQIPRTELGAHMDAANGPDPKFCNITMMTNTIYIVDFRITATYWENYIQTTTANGIVTSNVSRNPVLYNRWTETIEIDGTNTTSRTREGKFKIRSDHETAVTVDQLRTRMAVVGVPRGFIRESSKYTVSPDGLAMHYVVMDRQQFKMPPYPAFKAKGMWRESAVKRGTYRMGQATVRLEGSCEGVSAVYGNFTGGLGPSTVAQGTPGGAIDGIQAQESLIVAALRTAMTKILINARIGDAAQLDNVNEAQLRQALGPLVFNRLRNCYILEDVTIAVDMYNNAVEVAATALMLQTRGRMLGTSIPWGDRLVYTPYSDDQSNNAADRAFAARVRLYPNAPDYYDRGTASLLIQAAKYYDPTLQNNTLEPGAPQAALGRRPPRASNSYTGKDSRYQMTNGLIPGEGGNFLEDSTGGNPDPS